MLRSATVVGRSLVIALLAVAALAIPLGLTTSTAGAYPAANLTLTGHGYGHGRGLGQYGAYGYATQQGLDWHQILDHYYGGTHLGSMADAEIGVRLLAQDGADLTVTSANPFTVGGTAIPGGGAARISMNGNGEFFAAAANGGCGTTETYIGQITDPVFVPSVTNSAELGSMLTICGSKRTYRGKLRVANDNGTARTVNVVRMEEYLLGVIPRESPSSWGDTAAGMNALRAQAVAARSYAWAESRYAYAKTCDSESCQVYGGAGLNGTKLETANTTTARNDTWQAVRRFDSNEALARTEFSSSTGGWTAGGTFPAVQDLGDDVSPTHNWTQSIPVATVESSYALGTLQKVEVTSRNGLGADGGRVLKVVFTGSTKTLERTGDQVRIDFGLKSNWFSVSPPNPNDTTTTTTPGSPPTTAPPASTSPRRWLIPAALPPADALTKFGFGAAGDVLLSCDWNGDGIDTPGVYHNGSFTISNSQSDAPAGLYTFPYGAAGDTPLCGDWNGDKVDTVGIWRAGSFQLRNVNSPGPVQGAFRFGDATDQPIVGDWNGDRAATPGIHRGDRFFFANTFAPAMAVDSTYVFGGPKDSAVIGDWDGNGTDEPALHRDDRFYAGDGAGGVKAAFTFGVASDRAVAGTFAAGTPEVIGLVRG